jgi:hypothetical protein
MDCMLQVLKVTAIVLALILAGIAVLGLGVAAVNWLNGADEADLAASPTVTTTSAVTQVPAMDRAATGQIKTATFALG